MQSEMELMVLRELIELMEGKNLHVCGASTSPRWACINW